MLPFSYWRSVSASTNAFFIECFVDEIAHSLGRDPISYRLSHLERSSRSARVLRKVAEISNWSTHNVSARALGVAIFESFGSIVAQVAEVSQDKKVHVHKVWCVIDCGIAINPSSVKAQMEGGIHYGLSAALYGKISLKEGKIVESNFHNYKAVRIAKNLRYIYK